jgi:predicted Zn-dependent peptidase
VLAGWETGTVKDPELQPVAPIAEKKVYLVNRPNSVQTMLMMGNHGVITPAHPDFPAVQVMNRILGGGPTSRLFMRIREELGFTYGVGSNFRAQKYKDQFTASSSVRTAVTEAALDELLAAFKKMREEMVPQDDLDNAKRAIVAGFALSIESPRNAMGQTLSQIEFGLPADFWERFPEKVMAITAADVQRVARKYVPYDNLQIVAVGEGTLRDVLRKYGPVEEFDTDGRKVP